MKDFSISEVKFREMLLLGLCTFFCFTLSFLRIYYSGRFTYLFLSWNLFLAGIPWVISTVMRLKPVLYKRRWVAILLVSIWLVFFPNAPYIMTDLLHLSWKRDVPLWFDLILVLSYIWTALLYGFLSLFDMETIFLSRLSPLKRYLVVSFLLFLSGFGIYIGRFLRWNTWDIVIRPIALIYDVADRLIQPGIHPRTWGMTILLGVLLILMYLSLKFIRNMSVHD